MELIFDEVPKVDFFKQIIFSANVKFILLKAVGIDYNRLRKVLKKEKQ